MNRNNNNDKSAVIASIDDFKQIKELDHKQVNNIGTQSVPQKIIQYYRFWTDWNKWRRISEVQVIGALVAEVTNICAEITLENDIPTENVTPKKEVKERGY